MTRAQSAWRRAMWLSWIFTGQAVGLAAVRLLDERGLEWSAKNELDTALGSHAGLSPSSKWPPGAYADDCHAIRVLPGTPPSD
jgi:hypothetical protein